MVKDTDIIIGMGEIGKGLYEVINNSGTMVFGFDLNKETGKLKAYDIHDGSMGLSKAFVDLGLVKSRARLLHICIPGEVPCFHLVVADYIKEFNPEVTVIHSTVQVGTTTTLN